MKLIKSRILRVISMILFCMALFVGSRKLIETVRYTRVPDEISTLKRLTEAGDPAALAEYLDHRLVAIPAGDFIQGSQKGKKDEQPQRKVYLDSFEIDRYEISNAQYQRFVLEDAANPPRYWSVTDYPIGTADFPVVGVSWKEAKAYCEWSGKRLPTEAEWEKACRGTEGNVYPWGKRWKPLNANLGLEHVSLWPGRIDEGWQLLMTIRNEVKLLSPSPVGIYLKDRSAYGVSDMAGNVSEWVEDWYNWSDYTDLPLHNPVGQGPPWNHVIRGGAWFDRSGQEELASDLSRCAKRNSSHSADDPRVGFRCAKSTP